MFSFKNYIKTLVVLALLLISCVYSIAAPVIINEGLVDRQIGVPDRGKIGASGGGESYPLSVAEEFKADLLPGKDTSDVHEARLSSDAPSTIAVARAITITPDSVDAGKIDRPYAAYLTASGGVGYYNFSLASGKLPDGVELRRGGVIFGRPTEAGAFTFTVEATDEENNSGVQSYTLVIADSPTITIVQDSVNLGRVDQLYETVIFTTAGGTGPHRFAVTDGELPAGLELKSSGELSGTPTEAGSFPFTVTATNAQDYGERRYTLRIAAADAPVITVEPASLEAGRVDVAYEAAFTASGGMAPYIFAVTAGAPPAGLELKLEEGKLSGTPSEAGSFSFTVLAIDAGGHGGERRYTLRIAAADAPVITVEPASLEAGRVGVAYEAAFAASGGTAPYSFAVTGGARPAGLELKEGKLSGTPSEAGSFPFTVTATDAGGHSGEQQYTLRIAAAEAPVITIEPASLEAGRVGVTYEAAFTASGGTAPYSFAVTAGAPPAGLELKEGKLSGTPSEAGSFAFTVTATDADGHSGEQQYTLRIAAAEAPVITIEPASLEAGKVGVAYEAAFTASGGTAPYSFAVTAGAPPAGLELKEGKLSGTPTEAGSFAFTVTATDADGHSGEQQYTLRIAAAEAPVITIEPASLEAGKVGVTYEAAFTASGGTAPYSFAVTAGAPPAGLALKSSGELSGTPGASGAFAFTVTATDADGHAGSRQYMLAVIQGPVAQNHTLDVMAGTSGRLNLTEGASGGPFSSATIVAAAPSEAGAARIEPAGQNFVLVFDAASGFAGTTQLRYTLSNGHAVSAPATVTVNVVARPDPSKDAEVIGLVSAQTETAKDFARTQMGNLNRRLEQLHGEGECRANSLGLNVGLGKAQLSGSLDAAEQAIRDRQAAPACSNFALWSGGEISFGGQNDAVTKLDHTRVGVSGGIDYRFTSNFLGGIAFGYGHAVTDVGGNGTQSRAQAFTLSAYGSYRPVPDFYLDVALGYGLMKFESQRYVTASGDMASGARDGEQVFGALSLGYEYRTAGWLLSPYGRLEASHSKLHGFTEVGGGIYNLSYGDQSIDTLSATIGGRIEYAIPMEWGLLKPRARLEFTHDFDGSSHVSLGYADIGDLPYAIEVEPLSRDNVKIGLGAEALIGPHWNLGLEYQTAVGTDSSNQNHTVQVNVGARF